MLPVVTDNYDSINIFPVWSPDNRHILYGSTTFSRYIVGVFSPYIFQDVEGYVKERM